MARPVLNARTMAFLLALHVTALMNISAWRIATDVFHTTPGDAWRLMAALFLVHGALFLSPVMLRWMQARSVRHAVRTGFAAAALLFFAAGVSAQLPPLTAALLFAGSFFLILLDVSAGLPFLMAVKPSERTEMSAIYSSFRDVSGILTPGAAWAVLLVAPVSGIFTASAVALFGAFLIAGRLHPRLGARRQALQAAE